MDDFVIGVALEMGMGGGEVASACMRCALEWVSMMMGCQAPYYSFHSKQYRLHITITAAQAASVKIKQLSKIVHASN